MRVETITSAQNAKIKDLLALQEKSKERRKKGIVSMTINQLEYFCSVCRYHSISRAAEELYVSQPAISLAIKNLEKEFNASVQKEIEKRLAGSTPAKVVTKEGMTKEDFNKLPLAKQQQIYHSNPELFKALSQ